MTLLHFHDLKLYASEVGSRPAVMIWCTVLSIVGAFLYAVWQDFTQTFLKKPKHFVRQTALDLVRKPSVQAPLVELAEGENYRQLLARGSKMYPDRAYRIPHFPEEFVIVPYKCIEEIKNAPESKLSFQQGSYEFFLGIHTGITGHEQAMAALIRRDVGRLLDRVYSVVENEALSAVMSQIGPCEDWTEIVLLPRVVRMIIMISQRVFVGEPLCRDNRWLEAITFCTQGAFQSVTKLWEYNWFMRPLVAWRLPALRAVRKHKATARELLEPVLQKRLKDMEDPSFKSPPDLIQLVIDGIKGGEGRSIDYQVDAQIGTGRAALFTTGVTVFHLLYDLTIHSEYIEPLRQEVLALGEVPMNRQNVAKLTKMDSFIRECQRFSKFMLVGTIRKVVAPFKLSDGTELPIGTILGVDTQNAIFDNSTLEKPAEFDGFRFEKLRSIKGNEQKFQAVTTGADHLIYGYGTQACPGRFFAVHEAKVVLARILANYDFKLKDKGGPHPMSGADGILTKADPSTKFLFKRRVTGRA